MMLWIARGLVLVSGPWIGYVLVSRTPKGLLVGAALALLFIGLEFLFGRIIPLTNLIAGALGAVMGVIVAKLLEYLVVQIQYPKLLHFWNDYDTLIRVLMAYLGMMLAIEKLPELDQLDRDLVSGARRRAQELKLLDSSAIIDGRIVDVCETRFLSGTLAVPKFILQELHSLSDSSDNTKRARGRRGLDILARLQENPEMAVRILDRDAPGEEADAKIISLAKNLGACVVTTDFNLNKIAALQGVTVLNINDLTNALKAVVLPGESMSLFVMKEGKEKDQGIGYLDDGTMVVVEDGRRFIGKRVEVLVNSILQTSAGRMIFTKARGEKGDKTSAA